MALLHARRALPARAAALCAAAARRPRAGTLDGAGDRLSWRQLDEARKTLPRSPFSRMRLGSVRRSQCEPASTSTVALASTTWYRIARAPGRRATASRFGLYDRSAFARALGADVRGDAKPRRACCHWARSLVRAVPARGGVARSTRRHAAADRRTEAR